MINHQLVMDSIVINPGDLVIGDSDGVVIVRREDAEDVLHKSRDREQKEARAMERLRAGESTLDMYGFAQISAQRQLSEEVVEFKKNDGGRR